MTTGQRQQRHGLIERQEDSRCLCGVRPKHLESVDQIIADVRNHVREKNAAVAGEWYAITADYILAFDTTLWVKAESAESAAEIASSELDKVSIQRELERIGAESQLIDTRLIAFRTRRSPACAGCGPHWEGLPGRNCENCGHVISGADDHATL